MKSNSRRRMITPPEGLVITLLICVLGTMPFTHAMAQSGLEDLVRQSTFIFEGTVTKLQSATMPVVPVSDSTIVVKVDEVLQAPNSLSDYTGREVTVLVKDPGALRVGDQAVFFANGWLLGEGVAVQEVGRLKGGSLMDLRKEIATASQSTADQDLQEHIASVDVVVVGKVSDIRALAEPSRPQPITEHDPQWQEAILEVEAVLKGDASLKTIAVLFPGSLDVAWFNVPKFRVGQDGIWLLQEDRKIKAYTALGPLDFQPKDQLDRVTELVER